MTICFTLNDNYTFMLINVIKQIEKFCSEQNQYYILHSDLNEDNIKLIKQLKLNMQFVFISKENFSNAPILRKGFCKEAYYKLLIPYVLPKEIEYVLYLDLDICVFKDLSKFKSIDIQNYFLAAVPDYFVNKKLNEYVYSIGVNKKNHYFNSGVLYINSKKIRNEVDEKEIFNYIKINGKNFKFHDQEIWNAFFGNAYLEIGEEFNFLSQYRSIIDFFIKIDNKDKIIHYAGMKPWNLFYVGKFYKEYIEYNDISKYVNFNIKSWKYLFIIPIFYLKNIATLLLFGKRKIHK